MRLIFLYYCVFLKLNCYQVEGSRSGSGGAAGEGGARGRYNAVHVPRAVRGVRRAGGALAVRRVRRPARPAAPRRQASARARTFTPLLRCELQTISPHYTQLKLEAKRIQKI